MQVRWVMLTERTSVQDFHKSNQVWEHCPHSITAATFGMHYAANHVMNRVRIKNFFFFLTDAKSSQNTTQVKKLEKADTIVADLGTT